MKYLFIGLLCAGAFIWTFIWTFSPQKSKDSIADMLDYIHQRGNYEPDGLDLIS